MYNKMMSKLIKISPNLAIVKVYDFLINEEKFDGGVLTTKKYISDELKIAMPTIIRAFQWLIENKFIIETTRNGIPKFIINENIIDDDTKVNENESKKIESHEIKQPRQEIVRKGGKTITRMMVEGF